MCAPMVRALLEGRKTKTRRIVKGYVEDVHPPDWWAARRLVHKPTCQQSFCENIGEGELACGGYDCLSDGRSYCSPYGRPRDLLWVKETWAHFTTTPGDWPDSVEPEFSGIIPAKPSKNIAYRADDGWEDFEPWKPSIFMPRWASRITLELIAFRVERLQDISAEDARAEGIDPSLAETLEPVEVYRQLWESINGAGSWAANPFVWVLTFRRLP